MKKLYVLAVMILLVSCQSLRKMDFEREEKLEPFEPPVSYETAEARAEEILQQMSLDEKIQMIGGHDVFFTKGYEKYGIPSIRFSDATQGVSLEDFKDHLDRSVAFPAPICLASTWNTEIARAYALCVGEECRAGGIGVLLGPGMNLYRVSQCGRNFEYFGEDPFLAARMIENYVVGLQNTGTIATLKHFIANNSDFRRRTSNSIVGERALHEIYMPAFEAGINAGAMAVMTSYNQVNGEYASQSKYVINQLLRRHLRFKWLVMSDWLSIWDAERALKSGLDLDMPGEPDDGVYSDDDPEEYLKREAPGLIRQGKVSEEDINRMAKDILITFFAMESEDYTEKENSYLDKYGDHIEVAVETAREGVVLLKNYRNVLPLKPGREDVILLTGDYANKLAVGGGSAYVEGFDHVTLLDALKEQFEENLIYIENPSDKEIATADAVIYAAATYDSEGADVPFDLTDKINGSIRRIANFNPNTVIVMYTGGGKNLTPWNNQVESVLYCWYPGQAGNIAVAEIIAGVTNPSGKLPITIERNFKDSPGYPYLPEGAELYSGWENDFDMDEPVHNVNYWEGVFVGYRWYDLKNIKPLYAFGHGLSYSTFEYSNLKTKFPSYNIGDYVQLKVDVTNTSKVDGKETVQVYVKDLVSSVARPEKELKDFRKVFISAGEKKTVNFTLSKRDFAFWDSKVSAWRIENGQFEIMIGPSSDKILLRTVISMW